MDSEFIAAISMTADISLDASAPVKTFGANRIAARRSGSTTTGFYRPGERPECLLDGDNHPYPIEHDPALIYTGSPSGRIPTDDEKRGAWHLQDEYLAVRLGKNAQENARLWDTAKWIDRHHRIATTPADAIPPMNVHIANAILQDTGAPSGSDDESPDQRQNNEGVEFEQINVGEADSAASMKVTDEDGVTHRLEINADGYAVLRLADQLDECDELAKIDVNKLAKEAAPLPERTDLPEADDRAESGKLIRILMVGMPTLWATVIRAIADRVTMSSLGRSQGVGDDKAATVGRWRVIEGLRIADSIRRRLERQKLAPAKPALRKYRNISNVPSVNDMMPPLAAKSVRATTGHYLNQTAGPVIKLNDKALAANDNNVSDTIALRAA